MRFYLVTAKCGHVGRGMYIDVDFPVCAENGSDAAQQILKRSKVKKQLKNAITAVIEISEIEYNNYKEENIYSNYLKSHYKREYNLYDYVIKKLDDKPKRKIEFETREERISYLLRKNKFYYSNNRDWMVYE